jgi:serine/threonine protein phosphatase PrpC
VRAHNEDSWGQRSVLSGPARSRGTLFAIADGLGGHAGGEVASRLAVEALLEHYVSPFAPARPEPALHEAMRLAHLRVLQHALARPELNGMQTTLTALALAGRHAFIAHVGDGRVYRLRGEAFRLLTGDHSEAAELLRRGLITAAQAREHPGRHVLTRALGAGLPPRPDFARLPVQQEDTFVLCTDGLWGVLDDEEIRAVVAAHAPETACERLVGMANDRGGEDNITVQIVRVRRLVPPPSEASRGRVAALLARLILGGPGVQRSQGTAPGHLPGTRGGYVRSMA